MKTLEIALNIIPRFYFVLSPNEHNHKEFNKIKDVKEYARKEGFAKISLISITPKQKEKEYIL